VDLVVEAAAAQNVFLDNYGLTRSRVEWGFCRGEIKLRNGFFVSATYIVLHAQCL
jgi:hypothetical protein